MIVVAVLTVVTPIRTKGTTSNMNVVILAVAVSVLAVALYSGLGTPDAVTAENDLATTARSGSVSASASSSSESVGTVASLVDGLRARLEKEPDDANGWILLARSYEHLGRNQEALSAYNRARELGKTDPKLEESLVAASLSDYEPALPSGPAIRGSVALSEEAAALVQPGDTVFIFAKGDMNQAMPLLAIRKPVAELPIDYVLTDAMAMVPGSSLADFEEVFVIAQVSRSGRAKDVLGGLRVASDPVSPHSDAFIELLLDAGRSAE